jgi:hypothetical protein
MRVFAFAVLMCVALAAAGGDTQSLVEASKASKEKKKKSTTKVITNADVRKSKGVVKETKPAATPVTPQKSLLEQHEMSYRERLAREEQLAVTTKLVSLLESELASIEQSYYDENDLDKRDRDIARRFNEVKSKLDAARKELEALAPAGN